jgi:hypothetical protein
VHVRIDQSGHQDASAAVDDLSIEGRVLRGWNYVFDDAVSDDHVVAVNQAVGVAIEYACSAEDDSLCSGFFAHRPILPYIPVFGDNDPSFIGLQSGVALKISADWT